MRNKKDVIKISPSFDNQYQLEPIIKALNLDMSNFSFSSDLCFSDLIKKEFFIICKKKPMIFYIEHFSDFDIQTASFFLEIAELLLTRFVEYQTLLIFEFDIDEKPNQIKVFYKLPPKHTNFVCFNRLLQDELESHFFSVLSDIDISNENLTYIMNSSFGNIMYLNIIINYLKGENYIRFQNGRLICDQLPIGILSDVLKDFILQRYDRLDGLLKEILSKSSIIGNVFNANLLSKPFQIINADDLLKKIEKISKLITHPDDISYSFESKDAYNLIKSNISPQLQKEWHSVLAKYYEKLLKRGQQKKTKSIEKEITILFSVARHYKYAHDYDVAIIYYIELMAKYEQISDYEHELSVIKDIQSMLEYVDLDSLHLDSLEYDMLKAEADCYRNMGKFPQAHHVYEECLDYFELNDLSKPLCELLYQQAYCLYMDGNITNALKILDYVKIYLESNGICDELYIKLISILASVCDATGDWKSQKNYYIRALNYYKDNHLEKEYYVLLRMASMVFGEKLAISMEESAEIFFRKNHYTRYLAEVLHNIATDYLYIGELTKVSVPIDESINLFDSFGSLAVHCPLNTKGILKMALEKEFLDAVQIFNQALQYEIEPYSEITIRTNILNCSNLIGDFKEALKQLVRIDKLIELQSSQQIPVYSIYQNLNWAFYYFHLKKYDKCLEKIDICSHLDNMELRFKYVYKSLRYMVKKALGLKTRNTAGTAPEKIYKICVENGYYIATLRFYESM